MSSGALTRRRRAGCRAMRRRAGCRALAPRRFRPFTRLKILGGSDNVCLCGREVANCRGNGFVVGCGVRADARDVTLFCLVGSNRVGKRLGLFGDDLKACIAVKDFNGADFGLGDTARFTDQRHQPAWIGVAFTPYIEAEPHHVAGVFTPGGTGRAFKGWI